MSEQSSSENPQVLIFEYELDATPQKLWSALTIPELRSQWLPDLADSQPVEGATIAEKQISYKMREKTPPFLETQVTFQLADNDDGTTLLTITHELLDRRLRQPPEAANNNQMSMLMAA